MKGDGENAMAHIIPMPGRHQQKEGNVIASRPMEFRRVCRSSMNFIQIPRRRAEEFESLFSGGCRGSDPAGEAGLGWELTCGRERTILGLFMNRKSEETMRLVYYLAGLVDCMINQVSPLLRTDLLRSLYKEAFALKNTLGIEWSGRLQKVLLPIEQCYYSEAEYRESIQRAGTMKILYRAIENGTSRMFDVVGEKYVFYCSGAGGNGWKTMK